MEVLRVTENNEKASIDRVVQCLEQGGVIAYPTETVYGLGCDPTNLAAVERIYRIKNRAKDNAVLCLMPDLLTAEKYVVFNRGARSLAQAHWPGALTLVLPLKIEWFTVFQAKTLGVRVSSHPLTSRLLRAFNQPLVSTSANLSGQAPALRPDEVIFYFNDKVEQPDLLLAGEILGQGLPSTVVDVTTEEPQVLRQGAIFI
ncbi:MAG: L-threonylcarbamoyladenylate synthase [Candidatus Falkowbacteria bacterium]